jgi:hypothetical protein
MSSGRRRGCCWSRATPCSGRHSLSCPNEARQLSERLALPQLRQRLNERLGRLKRLQGNDEEALVALEEAIDGIERFRATVTHESMRTTFLLD